MFEKSRLLESIGQGQFDDILAFPVVICGIETLAHMGWGSLSGSLTTKLVSSPPAREQRSLRVVCKSVPLFSVCPNLRLHEIYGRNFGSGLTDGDCGGSSQSGFVGLQHCDKTPPCQRVRLRVSLRCREEFGLDAKSID